MLRRTIFARRVVPAEVLDQLERAEGDLPRKPRGRQPREGDKTQAKPARGAKPSRAGAAKHERPRGKQPGRRRRRSARREREAIGADEGAERLRDPDAAVLLLVLLEDRDQRAPDRQPGAVERVHEPGLGLGLRAVADLGAPRLEVARRSSSSRSRG